MAEVTAASGEEAVIFQNKNYLDSFEMERGEE